MTNKTHWVIKISPIGRPILTDIYAESLEIDNGTLIFHTQGKIIQAYAPGRWYEVSKIVKNY